MKTLIFLFLVFAAPVFAQEQIDLSANLVVDPTNTSTVKVSRLILDREDSLIMITVYGGGVHKTFTYNGQTAITMMNALNTANLTTNSLEKRCLNQLISDGYLSGTITGTPN